jgi:hypothetical protein
VDCAGKAQRRRRFRAWRGREYSEGCLQNFPWLFRQRRLPGLRRRPAAIILRRVDTPNENPPRYRWPWFVLAVFLLGVALAIVWMSYAVHREKQQRDVNAPLPAAPARQ